MIALVLAFSVSAADLQQWMDRQPAVAAYLTTRNAPGMTPPAEDNFRQAPQLPRSAACQARAEAMQASVVLFKAGDGGRVQLNDAALQAQNGGQPVLLLNDAGKKAISERAKAYEADAGRYEPACLG